MVSRLQKCIRPVMDFIKKAKTALTWRVFGSYLLIALPLVFLFAILFDIGLYIADPMRLPLPIIRLGTIAWAILAGLVSGVLVLVASKRFLGWLKQSHSFVQASLPTRRLKLAVGIASLITALIYPCYQAIASYSGLPRTAIPNTPYTGTVVVNDPLTSNRLGWEAIPSQQNACIFTTSGYEVRADNKSKLQMCLADKTNFSDFALQVEMTLMMGDISGILFRDRYLLTLMGGPIEGYLDLTVMTQNGYITDLLPKCYPLSPGCLIGESLVPQQTVTITIVARGTSIELYVDAYRERMLTNEVSSTGSIGVLAAVTDGQQDAQTEALFANMRIWTNIA